MDDFYQEAKELFEYSQSLRRDFHRNPELGFQEVRTAGIVARELNNLGLEVNTGIGQTGVVALLEGGGPGPVVLLRFDMDALPILEETNAEYASQNPGVMHACGHDGHTAIGLTVARLLEKHRTELNGTLKFMFQPAEEILEGAKAMLTDGLLEEPRPEKALSLHLWNEKPLGWIGVTPGPAMSASDRFRIEIIGRGGHGAAPHLTADPVLASAQVISALQGIVARNISPLKAAVISVTSVQGGEAFNVIPSSVALKGTIRSYDPDVQALLHERLNEIATRIAEAMGCRAEAEIWRGGPAVVNDARLAQRVQQVARQMYPGDEVDENERTMGSEDMAFVMERIPGCYFFVGSANPEKGLNAGHHHPRFDFDEGALPKAAALMAAAAVDLLGGE